MSIKSHKVIPKTILRQFISENNEFFYWIDYSSAPNFIIKRGYAKTFNTKKGYYSEELEEFLSKTVETHIKRDLLERAPNIQDEEIVLDGKFNNLAFLFLEALLSRNSEFHAEREEDPSDIVMTLTRLLKKECIVRDIYNVSYAVNNSNVPFTLPSNGIIQINETDIICPLSPHVSLLFYNSEENYYKDIDEDSAVMEINRQAFRKALQHNCSALICSQQNILKNLIDDYKTNELL